MSRHGSPSVLPEDVAPEEHAREATDLDHPFDVSVPPSLDLAFAIDLIVEMTEDIVACRERKLARLRHLVSECSDLDAAAR